MIFLNFKKEDNNIQGINWSTKFVLNGWKVKNYYESSIIKRIWKKIFKSIIRK